MSSRVSPQFKSNLLLKVMSESQMVEILLKDLTPGMDGELYWDTVRGTLLGKDEFYVGCLWLVM